MVAPLRKRIGVKVDEIDGRYFLTDAFDIIRQVELDPVGFSVFQHLCAGTSQERIRKLAEKEHGSPLSRSHLTGLINRLESLGVFETPRAKRERRGEFERRVQSNSLLLFGPQPSREGLTHIVDEARNRVEETHGPLRRARLEGAFSPHGDLDATGTTSAHAYALLEASYWPDVFIIIGTSHHHDSRPSILTHNVTTPLGSIETDHRLAAELRASSRPKMVENDPTFLVEHSWRQDLPLLQHIADELDRPLRIVAIQAGNIDYDQGRRLGVRISEVLFAQRKHGCLIASGDLTHYGASYAFAPPWLDSDESTTVRQVCERIAQFERPALEAIERRDAKAFAEIARQSSFCAHAQVSALLAFASVRGVLLDHQTILNSRPLDKPTSRRWRATDRLFNGASIAFWRGGTRPTATPGIRLCSQILFGPRKATTALIHTCDQAPFELDEVAIPAVHELLKGAMNTAELTEKLGGAPPYSHQEVYQLVDALEQAGWLHHSEGYSVEPSAFLRSRARVALERARLTVPYYRETLKSNDLKDAAPLLTSAIVKRWNDFTADGAPQFMKDGGDLDEHTLDPDLYYMRWSSGSTGKGRLATVVERAVREARERALLAITDVDRLRPRVSLNRPSNLGIAVTSKDRPGTSANWAPGQDNLLAPGFNASEVPDHNWDRCIDLVLRAKPTVLEGDPSYLAGLARRCLAHGVTIPNLQAVLVGHSYPWTHYLEPIQRAFQTQVVNRLNTSELGTLAIACSEGALHLAETHAVFEVLRNGRPTRAGESGALVVTSLDSRVRPLVRYVTGDLVRVGGSPCRCGRPFRTITHEGRVRDVLHVGRKRREVTQRDIDRTLGHLRGVSYFRIRIQSPASATASLELMPSGARELIDVTSIKNRLESVIRKRVRIFWKDSIPTIAPDGKLAALASRKRSPYAIYEPFLGDLTP